MPATLPNRTPSSGSGLEGLAQLGQFLDVLGLGGGGGDKKTTTSIDEQGMMRILQKIIEGTGGLADITSAQNISGGYDSTVNTLLTNDLLARASGEAASRNTAVRESVGGGGIGGVLTSLPGVIGAGKDILGIFGGGSGAGGGGGLLEGISGIFGGGSAAAGGTGGAATVGAPSGFALNSIFSGAGGGAAGAGGLAAVAGPAAGVAAAALYAHEFARDLFSGDASIRDLLNDTGVGLPLNFAYDLFKNPGDAFGNLKDNFNDFLDPIDFITDPVGDVIGGAVKGVKDVFKSIF